MEFVEKCGLRLKKMSFKIFNAFFTETAAMDLYKSHKNDVMDETNEILESIKELQIKQYKSVKNICSKLQDDRYERDTFIKKGSH